MQINNKIDKSSAFTLIELLVVISIISLLSTLAVISLGNARAKARDAKRMYDLKMIASALEIYKVNNGAYPIAGDGMNPISYCTDNILFYKLDVCWDGYPWIEGGETYFNEIPIPPQVSETYSVIRGTDDICLITHLETGSIYNFYCLNGSCIASDLLPAACQ